MTPNEGLGIGRFARTREVTAKPQRGREHEEQTGDGFEPYSDVRCERVLRTEGECVVGQAVQPKGAVHADKKRTDGMEAEPRESKTSNTDADDSEPREIDHLPRKRTWQVGVEGDVLRVVGKMREAGDEIHGDKRRHMPGHFG